MTTCIACGARGTLEQRFRLVCDYRDGGARVECLTCDLVFTTTLGRECPTCTKEPHARAA